MYFQLDSVLNVVCSDIGGSVVFFFSPSTHPLIIAFQREVSRSSQLY